MIDASKVLSAIQQPLTQGEKDRLNALLRVHAGILATVRNVLNTHGYVEIADPSLLQTSSTACNSSHYPNLSLQALSAQLGRGCFTLTQGRQFSDSLPASESARLADQTLVEIETTHNDLSLDFAKENLFVLVEELIRVTMHELLEEHIDELASLDCDIADVDALLHQSYVKITFKDALDLLGRHCSSIGCLQGLTAEHCHELLSHFCNRPIIITDLPNALVPFTTKLSADRAATESFHLLLPKVGLIATGQLHETEPGALRNQFSVGTATGGPLEEALTPFLKAVQANASATRGGLRISVSDMLNYVLPRGDAPARQRRNPTHWRTARMSTYGERRG